MKVEYKITRKCRSYVHPDVQLGSEESYMYPIVRVVKRFLRPPAQSIVYIAGNIEEAKKFKYMFEKGYVK
jgi:hypothetical protein